MRRIHTSGSLTFTLMAPLSCLPPPAVYTTTTAAAAAHIPSLPPAATYSSLSPVCTNLEFANAVYILT